MIHGNFLKRAIVYRNDLEIFRRSVNENLLEESLRQFRKITQWNLDQKNLLPELTPLHELCFINFMTTPKEINFCIDTAEEQLEHLMLKKAN